MTNRKLRCITINTDASFSPTYEVGGYAFYIVCDLFKIHKSGPFRDYVESAQVAEVMSIGNAIAALLRQKNLPQCDLLVINNDCKFAMNDIRYRIGGVAMYVASSLDRLNKRLKSKHDFRWVPAHTGSPQSRSKANEWCDMEAKKQMRLAVMKEQHKNKKHG